MRYIRQTVIRYLHHPKITSVTYGTRFSIIKRIFIAPMKQYIVNVNASLVMGNPMHPAPAWNIRTRAALDSRQRGVPGFAHDPF